MKKKYLLLLSLVSIAKINNAQISGDLQTNLNFFQRDVSIKAAGNPLYDNLLSGGESWLNLRYSNNNGFNASVRFDGFQNSNLLNPSSAYTAAGIGAFTVSKEFQGLTITAGHIYDQIGSGILFRAYEDRGLLIDNALFGLHLKYKLNNKLTAKAFTGQTKNLFDRYKPILKGANIEGDYDLGAKAHITPGIGVTNRTMDDASMSTLVSNINNLPIAQRDTPTYNMYAATIYNTLNAGDITWYAEAATKSKDYIADATGNLEKVNGSVLYSTLGYAPGKFGVNASAKRTENFVMRTSPNEILLKGIYNWQPIIATIRPQRLLARYTPASQDLSEFSKSVNGFYTPNDKLSFNLSYTHIDALNNTKLFREVYAETEIRTVDKMIFHLGFQYMQYNQAVYQLHANDSASIANGLNILKSTTPFAEITYKISEKKSIKADVQYMSMKGDYGSWVYALLEYDIAPKWAFAVSDMYNTTTGYNPYYVTNIKAQHYPNAFVAYTKNAHRFTAQYVKQIEGINCTGGVCRYEPAFSGFKIGVTSSF